MSFLDQVVEATNEMRNMEVNAPKLFRGLANPVGAFESTEELLTQAGLNWKVCELPILIQGTRENRLFDGKKALVRCDNGEPIEVVSEKFKVHQNAEMVVGMGEIIQAVNGKVNAGGYIPESGRVFLNAIADRKEDIAAPAGGLGHNFTQGAQGRNGKVGDIVRMEFFVSGGHKPGTPLVIKARAMRLRCTNGATTSAMQTAFKVTHRQAVTVAHIEQIHQWALDAVKDWQSYIAHVRNLNVRTRKAVQEAMILETVGGRELLDAAVAVGVGKSEREVSQMSGEAIIRQIIAADEGRLQVARGYDADWLLNDAKAKEVDIPRIATQVSATLGRQPGSEFTRGLLNDAYQGITYHVDHVRGRQGGAAVESAIMGEGDRLKRSALVTATQYAEVLHSLQDAVLA